MNVDLFKEGGRKEGEKDYLGGGQVLLYFFKLKKKQIITSNSPDSMDIFSNSVVAKLSDPEK